MERENLDGEAESEVVARWHCGRRVSAPERDISVEVVERADSDGVRQLSASVSTDLCGG